MERVVKGLCAILFLCMLTACTSKHEQNDIEKYVKNEYGFQDFVIQDKPEISVGEDGYKDQVWTIKVRKPEVTFQVVDDYFWGGESLSNNLKGNYEDVFLQKVFTQETFSILEVDELNTQGYFKKLHANYSNLSDVEAIIMEYQNLCDAYRENGSQNYPSLYAKNINPQFANLKEQCYLADEISDELVTQYIQECLQYSGDCKDATQQQIEKVINQKKLAVYVKRGDEKIRIPNVYAKSNSIYVDMLSDVLQASGYEVSREDDICTFVGINGVTYQYSTSFTKKNGDQVEMYYLKDSEEKKLLGDRISFVEINIQTGIQLFAGGDDER